MTTPASLRVSCIIAVYNGQKYLREALDSMLGQTYPNVEVVVVNDGSTDGTAQVLQSFGSRIQVLEQPNAGVSLARNRGVAASTGELICFLDADDWFDPRKTELQVAQFAADPLLDLCDCHSENFWSPDLSPEEISRDKRYALDFWRKVLPRQINSWMFRRSLWNRVGGFAPGMRYAEDVDWFSRARDLQMRRLTLPDVLTHRRLHPDNVTASNGAEHGGALANALRSHLLRSRSRAAH